MCLGYRLVISAGGNTPPILDATEDVFDLMSPPIESLGAMGFLDSPTAVRDDRQNRVRP